jgi:hypothetical protein
MPNELSRLTFLVGRIEARCEPSFITWNLGYVVTI